MLLTTMKNNNCKYSGRQHVCTYIGTKNDVCLKCHAATPVAEYAVYDCCVKLERMILKSQTYN